MARGVNKVILIGNLGQDPEVRYLPSGNPVANLRLATSDSWVDKNSGQRQERTEWHTVVLFNKLAEVAQQYLRKGSRLYVEGRLQTRKWQGQDGLDRYATEIVAHDLQMLDSRPGGQPGGQPGGGYGGQQSGGYGGQQAAAPRAAPPRNAYQEASQGASGYGAPPASYGGPAPGAFDDFDDEIPFDFAARARVTNALILGACRALFFLRDKLVIA